MLAFGGSVAVSTVFFTGFSVPWMVLLVNEYTQLAFPDKDGGVKAVDNVTLPEAGGPSSVAPAASSSEQLVGGFSRSECRKAIMVLAKRFIKVINKCGKELKTRYPTSQEYSDRFQCVIRCMLADMKLIDRNLAATNQTIAEFLDIHIPTKYHALAWHFIPRCLNEWGPQLDPSDEHCTSYGNYVKCLQNEISEC